MDMGRYGRWNLSHAGQQLPWAMPSGHHPNKERTRSIRPHRNQPNHQRILGHGFKGQKKHGTFPRSFLSQHKSRERKSRPKRHSQQPAARQCGGVSAGCSEPCQASPVSPPQSPHQSYLSPLCGQGQVIMGPTSLELAFYSLLMSLMGAFSLAWLPPDSTPISNQHRHRNR